MYFIHCLTLYDNIGFEKCFGIRDRSSFLKYCVYVFSFLYFLFFVNFLLYVTFFFRYFFSFISCVLFISKSCILYPKGYIIFCLSKTLSKKQAKCQAKSKQNAKQTSKQNRNRVANVADIILSYTLIGYKFAVSLFASVLLQLLLQQIRK